MYKFGITRTFQDIKLFEQMTVLDNLLVVFSKKAVFDSFFQRQDKAAVELAEKTLTRVGLIDKKNDLAITLSYGQRKLLEISRAIVANGNIYLFDEPFAGLFPGMVDVVSSVIKELRDEGNIVILIEHNMNLIREMSDFVFVLNAGKLLAKGSPKSVLEDARVIESYLGI